MGDLKPNLLHRRVIQHESGEQDWPFPPYVQTTAGPPVAAVLHDPIEVDAELDHADEQGVFVGLEEVDQLLLVYHQQEEHSVRKSLPLRTILRTNLVCPPRDRGSRHGTSGMRVFLTGVSLTASCRPAITAA